MIQQAVVLNSHNNRLKVLFKKDWDKKSIPVFEASYNACVRYCQAKNWNWKQE